MRVLVAAGVLRGYVEVMTFSLNRRVVVLLTVFFFALSGVLHGFAAAAMTADMPTMAASEAPASDEACGYCSSDGDMSAVGAGCQAVCPSLAFLGTMPASNQMSAEAAHPQAARAGGLSGRIGPPDPHPPKPVSLS